MPHYVLVGAERRGTSHSGPAEVALKMMGSKSLQVNLELLREVERAWKEIDDGMARKANSKHFLEELQTG